MKYLMILTCTVSLLSCNQQKPYNVEKGGFNEEAITSPEELPGLVAFWDFQETEGNNRVSKGLYQYELKEMNGPIKTVDDGIFGPKSADIEIGQWFRIQRDDAPGLNFHGDQHLSMVAWVKRDDNDNHWQYIAGMWNENKKRQYALFTNGHKQTDHTTLERTDAGFQVHGYVSDVGGATPDRPFSFSYATGKSKMKKDTWYMIAYTYDHNAIKVYFDGELDSNGNYNPFYWNKPIFDGGEDGADFTIAQRNHPKWPTYPEGAQVHEDPNYKEGFDGKIGGLAVYNRALTAEEIKNLYQSTIKSSQSLNL